MGTREGSDCQITKEMFSDHRFINYISRKHFKILKKQNHPEIIDLSKAGTFLNGQAIGKENSIKLNHNDLISIGTSKIKGMY